MNETAAPTPAIGALIPGSAVDLAPGVKLLPTPVAFPPGFVTAVALDEGDGWTIVDTGYCNADTKESWARFMSEALGGGPIRRVVATHHHPDHIGLAGWFQSEHGAELWTSRTAWLYARMLQLDAWEAPPPEAELFHRRAGYDDAMMARWRKRAMVNFSVSVAPMPLGVRTISEGERLAMGGRDWRVAFGHGHAPDHLVLIDDAAGIVLAGDQILPKITPNIGVYPTEPDGDPLGDWMRACADLQAHVDDQMLVAPGHGDPFRGARARLQNVLEKHERALERLAGRLSEPRTVVACFPALYRREITPALEGLATNETISHLNRLWRSGRATRELTDDGVWLWRAIA